MSPTRCESSADDAEDMDCPPAAFGHDADGFASVAVGTAADN